MEMMNNNLANAFPSAACGGGKFVAPTVNNQRSCFAAKAKPDEGGNMTALRSIRLAAFGVGLASCLLAPATAEETVRIGIARSVSNGAELIAIEKGYFREAGIKVEIDDIDTSANTIALLATNRLQIIAGGVSAGYFNAIEKNLPITIIADRVSTPIGHNLMLRPDLKDKITSLAQLKAKVIGSNGAG